MTDCQHRLSNCKISPVNLHDRKASLWGVLGIHKFCAPQHYPKYDAATRRCGFRGSWPDDGFVAPPIRRRTLLCKHATTAAQFHQDKILLWLGKGGWLKDPQDILDIGNFYKETTSLDFECPQIRCKGFNLSILVACCFDIWVLLVRVTPTKCT